MLNPKMFHLYAESLVEVGLEHNILPNLQNECKEVNLIILEDSKFANILNSYLVNHEEKYELINNVFGPFFSSFIVNFLKVLVKNNIIIFLKPILSKFNEMASEHLNIAHGQIETAFPISQQKVADLEKLISKKISKKVFLKPVINSNLISGIKITVDHQVFENSIDLQLKELKSHLLKLK